MNKLNLREAALAVIEASPFPFFATIDRDVPRLRPVSPVRVDGFTVWIASIDSSGKTEQIRANNNVEICFMTPGHEQVRITGKATEITDHDVRLDIWNSYPLLKKYFRAPDDQQLIIYRIDPEQVRFLKEWGMRYSEVPI